MMFPSQQWVGFALIVLAFFGFILFGIKRERRPMTTIGITPILWIILGTFILIFGTLVISHGVNLAWPPAKKEPISISQTNTTIDQPTFREKVDKISFQLGGRGISVGYKYDQLKNAKKKPFLFKDYSPVTLYVENDKLYADVKLYAGTAEPPIEIVHNEFTVRRPGWDKNYNLEALEIVNDKQQPIFQLIYKSKTHIVIKGIFPYPGGLILAGEGSVLIFTNSQLQQNSNSPKDFALNRIFKYPSSKYLGQLDDAFKPHK